MNIKDTIKIAELICYHFVTPIKEYGVDPDELANNGMRFIQDLCEKYPAIAEEINFFETPSNEVAGGQFLDELNIKHS
jgi:hypothetical protein